MLSIEHPAQDDTAAGSQLIDLMLREQHELTAVERFARRHDSHRIPAHGPYRELIPLTSPQPGQQYGFEVDLDACSGCKACVTACHAMNGLDDDEVWRTVGLIQGGTKAQPFFQMVTSACHHCADPACMNGCPVQAYEKDQFTGIVKHLDDQCIGCQYCVLKCPYDVPKYSASRGIVRKCDMCSSRLAAHEAPACVQACPNEAIRITVVDLADVAKRAEQNIFLPGAPAPAYTHPTTVYKKKLPLPLNALAADDLRAKPEHAHFPLVVMLVLTQLSLGMFFAEAAGTRWLAAKRSSAGRGAGVWSGQSRFVRRALPLGPAAVRVPRVSRVSHILDEPRDHRLQWIHGRRGRIRRSTVGAVIWNRRSERGAVYFSRRHAVLRSARRFFIDDDLYRYAACFLESTAHGSELSADGNAAGACRWCCSSIAFKRRAQIRLKLPD